MCFWERQIEWQHVESEKGFALGWCDHMLIVACMENSDWVNLCAPDSERNREGGHGTYSWLESRQAVQSCGYMRDKPISTASVEMRLAEGALGQNAGIQICHACWCWLRLFLSWTSLIILAFYFMLTMSFISLHTVLCTCSNINEEKPDLWELWCLMSWNDFLCKEYLPL